jgi:hypothetical protein
MSRGKSVVSVFVEGRRRWDGWRECLLLIDLSDGAGSPDDYASDRSSHMTPFGCC